MRKEKCIFWKIQNRFVFFIKQRFPNNFEKNNYKWTTLLCILVFYTYHKIKVLVDVVTPRGKEILYNVNYVCFKTIVFYLLSKTKVDVNVNIGD
jgi:hypothetical protein